MTMSSRLALGLPALLFATFASPLVAAPGNEERITVTAPLDREAIASERVRHADLNLALASNQKLLQRRISKASRRVCSSNTLGVSVSDEQFVGCTRAAVTDAAPQVAEAIERARQIAVNGTSAMPAVGILVAARF